MWTSFTEDLTTALVLMVVAASLGGLLVWLVLRSRHVKEMEFQLGRISELKAETARLSSELDLCQKKNGATQPPMVTTSAPVSVATPPKDEDEATTLARIQQRAAELDFSRIGLATADEKDDLKIIKGIGPFIEKKLNSIGIYTFRQIANFTLELEDKVNDIIEFFPGRIRRDEWVRQAEALAKEKEKKAGDQA